MARARNALPRDGHSSACLPRAPMIRVAAQVWAPAAATTHILFPLWAQERIVGTDGTLTRALESKYRVPRGKPRAASHSTRAPGARAERGEVPNELAQMTRMRMSLRGVPHNPSECRCGRSPSVRTRKDRAVRLQGPHLS